MFCKLRSDRWLVPVLSSSPDKFGRSSNRLWLYCGEVDSLLFALLPVPCSWKCSKNCIISTMAYLKYNDIILSLVSWYLGDTKNIRWSWKICQSFECTDLGLVCVSFLSAFYSQPVPTLMTDAATLMFPEDLGEFFLDTDVNKQLLFIKYPKYFWLLLMPNLKKKS